MSGWKPGQGQRLDILYAWVATEPDGGEGVCSAEMTFMGRPIHMPLVGGDFERIRSLREHAETIRRATGYPIRLVRFTQREDLEELP